MHIVLVDTPDRSKLFPITLNRAVADVRMGIFTVKERWERITNKAVSVLTHPVIQPLYEQVPTGDCLFINAALKPEKDLVERIFELAAGETLVDDEGFVAGRLTVDDVVEYEFVPSLFKEPTKLTRQSRIVYPCDIFKKNADYLLYDFGLLNISNNFLSNCKSSHLISEANIFVEEGATVDYAIMNASAGPIYIGKNATVMEGSLIRGPFALCEGATVKMGTKVYGATTVGPYSVIGGEVKNSVVFAYSNKGHDGYLGDSVIGEWCNLGAGTSNSNLKNTAADVKSWSYHDQDFVSVGNKCGVIMGDYSRTAINTSINTGTVIGLCCNVFGDGLTPKLLSDFSWGLKEPKKYEFDKASRDMENWKKLKNKILTEPEKNLLRHIFDNNNC